MGSRQCEGGNRTRRLSSSFPIFQTAKADLSSCPSRRRNATDVSPGRPGSRRKGRRLQTKSPPFATFSLLILPLTTYAFRFSLPPSLVLTLSSPLLLCQQSASIHFLVAAQRARDEKARLHRLREEKEERREYEEYLKEKARQEKIDEINAHNVVDFY
jgi:hypothetical protein